MSFSLMIQDIPSFQMVGKDVTKDQMKHSDNADSNQQGTWKR